MMRAMCSAFAAASLCILLVGCDDPLKETQKIFGAQGLVLLAPARDYIKPGGLVVLPSNGGPVYLDPFDPDIAGQNGNYVEFKSIIAAQAKNQVTGLDVALSAISTVIPLPAKLSFQKGQQVKLAQIDTAGQRILTGTVLQLLKRKATGDALRGQLAQKNRAFVVQEIYTARSISMSSASNAALDVSYGGAGKVPDCTLPSTDGKGKTDPATKDATKGATDATKGATDATKADATKGATDATKAATDKTGKTPATTAKTDAKTDTGTAKDATAKDAKDTAKSVADAAGSGLSASLGFCHAGTATLTLQSDSLIPIAVRLNEIVQVPGGLDVKYGQFKFPNSLGASDVEKFTATNVTLPRLTHGKH
jgi:hypothetical protein